MKRDGRYEPSSSEQVFSAATLSKEIVSHNTWEMLNKKHVKKHTIL
jgi:hypothetical protein